MRSLLWTSVFVFLMLELALTAILVVPVPRRARNWICLKVSKLELKNRLRIPLTCIFFALTLALVDTSTYLQQIYTKERNDETPSKSSSSDNYHQHVIVDSSIDRHLIKEKEYRAGRNMYLVAFALTLLFVIGRITELMQEHAELEERVDRLIHQQQQQQSTVGNANASSSTTTINLISSAAAAATAQGTGGGTIEMKPIQLKKDD